MVSVSNQVTHLLSICERVHDLAQGRVDAVVIQRDVLVILRMVVGVEQNVGVGMLGFNDSLHSIDRQVTLEVVGAPALHIVHHLLDREELWVDGCRRGRSREGEEAWVELASSGEGSKADCRVDEDATWGEDVAQFWRHRCRPRVDTKSGGLKDGDGRKGEKKQCNKTIEARQVLREERDQFRGCHVACWPDAFTNKERDLIATLTLIIHWISTMARASRRSNAAQASPSRPPRSRKAKDEPEPATPMTELDDDENNGNDDDEDEDEPGPSRRGSQRKPKPVKRRVKAESPDSEEEPSAKASQRRRSGKQVSYREVPVEEVPVEESSDDEDDEDDEEEEDGELS